MIASTRHQHSLDIPSTFSQHSLNIPSTLSQHSFNTLSTFSQHPFNISSTFCQDSINTLAKFFENHVTTSNIPPAFPQHSLKFNQYALKVLLNSCHDKHSASFYVSDANINNIAHQHHFFKHRAPKFSASSSIKFCVHHRSSKLGLSQHTCPQRSRWQVASSSSCGPSSCSLGTSPWAWASLWDAQRHWLLPVNFEHLLVHVFESGPSWLRRSAWLL